MASHERASKFKYLLVEEAQGARQVAAFMWYVWGGNDSSATRMWVLSLRFWHRSLRVHKRHNPEFWSSLFKNHISLEFSVKCLGGFDCPALALVKWTDRRSVVSVAQRFSYVLSLCFLFTFCPLQAAPAVGQEVRSSHFAVLANSHTLTLEHLQMALISNVLCPGSVNAQRQWKQAQKGR